MQTPDCGVPPRFVFPSRILEGTVGIPRESESLFPKIPLCCRVAPFCTTSLINSGAKTPFARLHESHHTPPKVQPTPPPMSSPRLACLHLPPRPCPHSTAAPAPRLPRATCAYTPHPRTAATRPAYPHRHRRGRHPAPHPAPSPYTTRAPHAWRAVSHPVPHTRGVPFYRDPRPSFMLRRTATFQTQK